MKNRILRTFSFTIILAIMIGLFSLAVVATEDGSWIPIVEEDFGNFTDNGWSAIGNGAVDASLDSVLVLESSQNLDTGITNTVSELAGVDSFRIAFDARVESFTDGHSTATKTADNASLGMKISLSGSRIMFAIEEDHIDTSSSGGTWANDIALDANNFNTANWQHYEIVYVKSTGIFEVYVNGTKVGEGAKQTHAGTTMSGINIWANGDENNYAKSYVDNLTASVLSGSEWNVVFEDDFDNLTDAAWGKINGNATTQAYVDDVRPDGSALSLATESATQVGARLGIDISTYDKFKISFKGKVNKYTTGHGSPDCTTLGLNVGLGDRRIMFAIEKNHIDLSSTTGTWGSDITLDSEFYNTSDWQTYDIIYDKYTYTADVYVNGNKVGSGGSQPRNSGTYMQFWSAGYSAENAAEAYVDDLTVSYWQVSGLPSWETGAKITTVRTADGFTVSWPAADKATSYDVTIDGETTSVTLTSFTATGLELVDGGHSVSVIARNDKGVSASTLTATSNPQFDPEVHNMDVEKILKGNTSGGDGIYSHYRIPGIVVSKQNTVIMYFEARTGLDDWSPMDLLAYRSTDGGNSFGEPIKIVEGVSTGTTINNPTMIVGNDGTLHLLYCVEYGICTECNSSATSACTHGSGVFYTKSTNDGVSWSAPENISDSTSPDVRNVFAVGPGHGICLDDGTLLATVWYVRKDVGAALESHYTSEVCTIYSKDNGNTWQLGEEVPRANDTPSPNETMLAKTSDGRIMLSIRTTQGGYRAVSWSDTGYSDWSTMKLDTTLVDPTCMGSLYAYDVEGYPYMILSSNCNSTSGRRNLTLRASLDDGETWTKELIIEPGLAGYSDLAVDENGTIYVLYEVEAGLTVNLARLTPAAFGLEKEETDSAPEDIFDVEGQKHTYVGEKTEVPPVLTSGTFDSSKYVEVAKLNTSDVKGDEGFVVPEGINIGHFKIYMTYDDSNIYVAAEVDDKDFRENESTEFIFRTLNGKAEITLTAGGILTDAKSVTNNSKVFISDNGEGGKIVVYALELDRAAIMQINTMASGEAEQFALSVINNDDSGDVGYLLENNGETLGHTFTLSTNPNGTELNDTGSTNIGVNGSFVAGEADAVVCVQLSWTETVFKYSVDEEWNNEQYINVPIEGSGSWSQEPATIMVTNHSNQVIGASFTFTPDYVGISGKFTSDEDGNTEITEVSLDSAEVGNVEKVVPVYFFITDGELPSTHKEVDKIGDITITISAKGK